MNGSNEVVFLESYISRCASTSGVGVQPCVAFDCTTVEKWVVSATKQSRESQSLEYLEEHHRRPNLPNEVLIILTGIRGSNQSTTTTTPWAPDVVVVIDVVVPRVVVPVFAIPFPMLLGHCQFCISL